MDIVNNKHNDSSTSKPNMEQVEQEKQEYKLIGRFLRRKGLILYSYNSLKDELKELDIKYKDNIIVIPQDGKLLPIDLGLEEATVDSRNIHLKH